MAASNSQDAANAGRQRGPGRPFRKGQSGNPAGKRPGTLNTVTVEFKRFCSLLVDDPEYQAALRQRMIEGKAGAMEPVVTYFAKGKPKATVEISIGEEQLKALPPEQLAELTELSVKARAMLGALGIPTVF
jgi:hypothetical protein